MYLWTNSLQEPAILIKNMNEIFMVENIRESAKTNIKIYYKRKIRKERKLRDCPIIFFIYIEDPKSKSN